MTELKPCPFCGSAAITEDGDMVGCGGAGSEECPLYGDLYPIEKWDIRPDHVRDATKMIPLRKWEAGEELSKGWYWTRRKSPIRDNSWPWLPMKVNNPGEKLSEGWLAYGPIPEPEV